MPTLSPLLLKLIGVLAGLAFVAGGAAWLMHSHDEKVFEQYKIDQAAAAGRQVGANKAAVAGITASEAAGLRTIAAQAQESRNEIQKRNDALVGSNAALAATVGKLQNRLASAGRQAAVVSSAAASGPVADGTGDTALPVGLADLVKFNAAQFLAADNNAVTVTALQDVVKQDREICNGALPGMAK